MINQISSHPNTPPESPVQVSRPKEAREVLRDEINRERRLMVNIAYLTTLQQLGDSSDLDNLFDGQIHLGDEEPLTTFALLDIFNGNHTFSHIKPPQKMTYERNFALDSSYNIDYEAVKSKNGEKSASRLSALAATTNFIPGWLGDTKINFSYDTAGKMEQVLFERSKLSFNERIRLTRNTQGLVEKIDIGNLVKVDNTITIEYKDAKPFSMKQTKYGAFDDETFFLYDDAGNLVNIVYVPAISAKMIRSSLRRGTKSIKGAGQAVEAIIMDDIKRTKGVDIVDIQNHDGIPMSTKSKLDASNWFWTDAKSGYEWNGERLKNISLEMQNPPLFPNDRKKIIID